MYTVVNFPKILQAAFVPITFGKKVQNQTASSKSCAKKNSISSGSLNVGEINRGRDKVKFYMIDKHF
jgi:hypothetical protein